MDTAVVVVLVVGGLFLVGLTWMLHCNNRTLKFRLKMLDRIRAAPRETFWDRHRDYDTVNYDQTLWAYVLFQDPLKLYPQALQEIMK